MNKTFPGYFEAFASVATPVPVIAIDGPSASGKGTVAALVAEALGYRYLDSGSIYRIVALAAMRAGVPPGRGTGGRADRCRIACGLRSRQGAACRGRCE